MGRERCRGRTSKRQHCRLYAREDGLCGRCSGVQPPLRRAAAARRVHDLLLAAVTTPCHADVRDAFAVDDVTLGEALEDLPLTNARSVEERLARVYSGTTREDLINEGRQCAENNIATGSADTYRSWLRGYVRWCRDFGQDPRENPDAVLGYLVFRAADGRHVDGKKLAPASMRGILHAISRWHRSERWEDPTVDPDVQGLLESYTRKHGRPPKPAMAATIEQLGLVSMRLFVPPRDNFQKLVAAMLVLDPFSEMTFTKLADATWEQIVLPEDVTEPAMLVTDTTELAIPATPDTPEVCPVTLLRRLGILTSFAGPLYAGKDGELTSRQNVTNQVKRFVQSNGLELQELHDERTHNVRPSLSLEDRKKLADSVYDPTPEQRRDLAIILLGALGGHRAATMSYFDVGDIQFDEQGVIPLVRKSKSDQYGEGRREGIARQENTMLCAATALQEWLEIYEEVVLGRPLRADDPLFCDVRGGKVLGRRLSPSAVSQIWVRRFADAGLVAPDGFRISAHTGRATHDTMMIAAGHSAEVVSNHGHRKNPASLARYVRAQTVWQMNPTVGLTDVDGFDFGVDTDHVGASRNGSQL